MDIGGKGDADVSHQQIDGTDVALGGTSQTHIHQGVGISLQTAFVVCTHGDSVASVCYLDTRQTTRHAFCQLQQAGTVFTSGHLEGIGQGDVHL